MISLIIPVYNEEEMLKQYDTVFYLIVDGLKKQFNEEFEIVLIDDASADSSWKIIDNFTKKRPDTIGLKHQKNGGWAAQ